MKEAKREAPCSFPENVLEHVLVFVTSPKDRNAVSLVCKAWCKIEGWSRYHISVGNCYAVSPEIVIKRFPRLRSLSLKGKPRFADFGLFPANWGADLFPWIQAMSIAYTTFESLKLKRMNVTDECLFLLAQSFPNFRSLVFTNCEGFSTYGLAAVTSQCRDLTELQLLETEVDDFGGEWLSSFPETSTSLEALNFACLNCDVDFVALESLVSRSPSLKILGLNKKVSMNQLRRLILKCNQLTELGTGIFNENLQWEQLVSLKKALINCRGLRSLCGFWEVDPVCLPVLYPVCWNLTSLNLSYVTIRTSDLAKLLSHCNRVRRLWLQDNVEDKGLLAVAKHCKELDELRVFLANPAADACVTEEGLIAIAEGCPKLTSLLYFCKQMTNAAIVKMSKACPKIKRFRLCIITKMKPDHVTGEPLDEGFGAIVKNCKDLKRLAISGWLTDRAFEYIGAYGKGLETLSLAFAGDSDLALQHVFKGCTKLRKLEILDCPFGDLALLAGIQRYESMRFLFMANCNVTSDGCRQLAHECPRLNVEMIKENESEERDLDRVYVYRSVAGPREDMPPFVITLRGDCTF